MKTLLLLLLTCLPLCAATTYPMLSTTTNRTVTGGVTNMSLLNANQTFTGTNTFPAAGLFPANNIGFRLLYSYPTNNYFNTIATNALSVTTNNGGYAFCTPLVESTLPALLGSNSILVLNISSERTQANLTLANFFIYAGPNTNFVGYFSGCPAAQGRTFGVNFGSGVFRNANSFTNQVVNYFNADTPPGGGLALWGRTSIVDTSVPFKIYIGASTATYYTNYLLTDLSIGEFVK